jgi:hypothetical protein
VAPSHPRWSRTSWVVSTSRGLSPVFVRGRWLEVTHTIVAELRLHSVTRVACLAVVVAGCTAAQPLPTPTEAQRLPTPTDRVQFQRRRPGRCGQPAGRRGGRAGRAEPRRQGPAENPERHATHDPGRADNRRWVDWYPTQIFPDRTLRTRSSPALRFAGAEIEILSAVTLLGHRGFESRLPLRSDNSWRRDLLLPLSRQNRLHIGLHFGPTSWPLTLPPALASTIPWGKASTR